MAAVKSYLYTSFDFVLSISIPLTFGIAAVATTLAPWFFGKSFTSVNSLLIIEAPVIVLIGQSNVIGQQYLLPTKNMRTYTASVVIGAIVNIILNIPLIILWGVKGAMFATLLSELVVTTYQLIMVRHIFKFKNYSRISVPIWLPELSCALSCLDSTLSRDRHSSISLCKF